MADITYHEKAGANPNEPASEDTVVDVLRKAVDKRVSSPQYPLRITNMRLANPILTSVTCL